MRTAALHSISILIALALAVATARGAQTPPLQMCLTTAADFSPIYPTTSFPNNLREVSCSFALNDHESFGTLTSIWTAVDVGDVAPPNYEIARADTPIKDMKRGRFRYSQDGPMPAGKYKLDVLADGKPWHSLEFTVVAAAQPTAIKKPADLFPLEKGKTWSYDFVQESAKGAKITLPGIEPDAQGRFHASVTMTVDKTEPHGTHIEIRRNGELVAEEWWKLGAKGLSATQRKIGDELIKLEPPQILWALPLQTPSQWTYAPKDGSFTQTYSMWGPLPVRGPSGDQPGYIIAIEQPSSMGKLSVERRLIPGVGLTDEIIISAINGEMVSRQEMSLSSAAGAAQTPPSSPTDAGADYFPLAQGAVWTYMATVDGNDRMVSKKVSRSEKVKGLDCFVVDDDGFSGFLTKMHLHKSAEAVQLVKASFTMKQPLTWIKLPLKKGDSWTGQLLTTDNQDGGTLRFSVEDDETIDTPAGKYQAMRVRMDGQTAGPSLRAMMWFAPGIGEVKRSATLIDVEHDNKVLSQIDMALFEYSDGTSASINSAAAHAAPIKFETDFRKGLERADAEGKPLLVEFYSPKCPFCAKMAKEVYPNPKVAALADGFVWARINQDDDAGAQLSRQFNGGATPTYMAIAQDGKTVYYRFSDAVSVDGFIENLSAIAVSPAQYLPVIEKFKHGEQPDDQAKLILARGTLREANMDVARTVLTKLAEDDPSNASGIVDDVLILSGHLDNALWTDDGAAAARKSWMRIVKEFPNSDRAPDAVFYLSELFREVGPKDKAEALQRLLTKYPSEVDVDAAAKILEEH